jgi:putative DNA primase/helicase
VVSWTELQSRRATEAELRRWWERGGFLNNVGLVMGQVTGLVGLDPDGPAGEAMMLAASSGDLPSTLEFATQSGRRLLYAIPPGLVLRIKHDPARQKSHEGFSILAEGSQTVAPPSEHRTDRFRYAWKPGHGPHEIQPAPAPQWIIDRCSAASNGHRPRPRRPKKTTMSIPLFDTEPITEGGRNSHLASEAGKYRHAGFDEEAIATVLLEENAAHCDPPLEEAEVLTVAHSIASYPPGPSLNGTQSGPPDQALADPRVRRTDVGNAYRLASEHGADLRHCHPWRKWLIWDGRHWQADTTGAIASLARGLLCALFSETAAQISCLAADPGPDAKNQLRELQATQAWYLRSMDTRRLTAMIEVARSEPGIPVLPPALDRDPWLLNCPNGTVDLRTGELRAHCRTDLITKLCPVEYHPDAQCPTWERVLGEIFRSKQTLVDYLRRLLGYCLTGDVREHVLPVLWGNGRNGKTTLLTAVGEVLGEDYATAAPPDLLLAQRDDSHPTALADLFGRRLVVCQETGQGRRLNESLVKWVTGGDKIRARRMREDYWQFAPTHKVFLVTNYRPDIVGCDEGIWRRIQLVPFLATFLPGQADELLPQKLRGEYPGILAWLVRGCLEWQRVSLSPPAEVVASTRRYREEQDTIARWAQECCVIGEALSSTAAALYASFVAWFSTQGEGKPVSQKSFGQQLGQHGYRGSGGDARRYHGIALREEASGEVNGFGEGDSGS